jgi:alpha-amylase/alpha-mannosidase (GH57 family)
MSSVIIHGHFYQPPRENPWTGALDREESARPFHDWNERIHAECYRPNAFARITDGRDRIERIVNNYARVSFNFGPTLLSWIEREHPDTYARILQADRESVGLHDGHGNAIAQGYNHAILPLCNDRDRRTQVLWGIADFRHRFGRAPESLWMPETACNDATLGTLIDAGLAYVILSPTQAERVRPIGSEEWRNVSDGSINPRVPYRYFHPDGTGRSIAIFFYDGAVARAIAFEGALAWSDNLINQLTGATGDGGELVNVATDGESYGHHFHFGDRCLAYALEVGAPSQGLQVTNYGKFLAGHPPQDEVRIKPGPNGEGTAWSCSHGVGRWYRDCGCQTGGQEAWNQAWRSPLRQALDLLRDEAARQFEEAGGDLLRDPWTARDGYIELILDRDPARRQKFLHRHARRRLDEAECVRTLNLLEAQRNAMLMYTSCGWFFADISGIETVQVLKYAGRVLDFMGELDQPVPLDRFLEALAEAESNIKEMGNGADVYRRFVRPSRVTPERLAAHLAISGLAGYGNEGEIGDYLFSRKETQKQEHGRLILATDRILLKATTTGRERDYAAAALHLGGMDFYCVLKAYPGSQRFKRAIDAIWKRFPVASLPTMLRLVQAGFGPEEYGLDDVLPDGRRAICEMVFGSMFEGFTAQFMRLYEENRRMVAMLHEAGFELPKGLRQITEVTLGQQFEQEIIGQAGSRNPAAYSKAVIIAQEALQWGYLIDKSGPNLYFGTLIADAVQSAVAEPSAENLQSAMELTALAKRLRLASNLDLAQEAVYAALTEAHLGYERLAELAKALNLSPAVLKMARVVKTDAAHAGVSQAPVPPKS